MKKYFIMAVAVLASLTACQKDPEQILVNDGTIKFMSLETRALTEETPTTDLDDLKNANGSFTVYGFIKGETNALWETGVQPKWDGSTTWTVTPNEYWADAKYYNFYAFYNQGTDVTADYTSTVVEFDGKAEATTDFVAASKCEIRGQVANAPVDLAFHHQLARVAFKFVNKFNDPNNTIKVTDITVNAPTAATFTYTAPSTLGEATVAVSNNTTLVAVPFDFTDDNAINGAAVDATTYNDKTTVYKYFVPAKGKYEMSCTVTFVTKVDGKDVTQTKTYPITLPETDYLAGQSYLFTANVYDAIQPITFTVSVDKWGTDTPAGDITVGQDKQ